MLMQKDYFCCDICKIAFQPEPEARVPFVIECGHTFCGECIQKACSDKCPNCRVKVDSSRKKKNFHILSQIQDCNTLNPPERIQEIQRCPISQSPMDQFCTSCLAPVCRDCFEGAHKPTHATIKICPENENLISNILKAKQARNASSSAPVIHNFISKANSLIESLESAKIFAAKYKDVSLSDAELRKIVAEYTETGEDTSGKLSGVGSYAELERMLGELVETKEYKEFTALAEKLKGQQDPKPSDGAKKTFFSTSDPRLVEEQRRIERIIEAERQERQAIERERELERSTRVSVQRDREIERDRERRQMAELEERRRLQDEEARRMRMEMERAREELMRRKQMEERERMQMEQKMMMEKKLMMEREEQMRMKRMQEEKAKMMEMEMQMKEAELQRKRMQRELEDKMMAEQAALEEARRKLEREEEERKKQESGSN